MQYLKFLAYSYHVQFHTRFLSCTCTLEDTSRWLCALYWMILTTPLHEIHCYYRGKQNYSLCCVFTDLVIFGFLNKILMKCDTEGPYLAVSTTIFCFECSRMCKNKLYLPGSIGNCNRICFLLYSPFLW